MKKLYRMIAAAIAAVMIISSLAACDTKPQTEDPPSNTQSPKEDPPSDPTPHTCESTCAECGNCEDPSCQMSACEDKCSCSDTVINDDAYGYFPLIDTVMPAIYINTSDKSNDWATRYTRYSKLMGWIDYTDATISTIRCKEEHSLRDVEAEVKVRGNYTLDYEKKPIRIKFKEKNNLLGLHDGEEYKNWVLLAEWKDLSMMNNSIAFYLGNTILGSNGFYCTDFRHVEVYLNGVYWGVYLLVEQQEVKDGRTSAPAVPKDYTGNDIGYFFEYDAYYDLENMMPDGDPTFVIDHRGVPAGTCGYTIKSDIHANSQVDFLQKYMNNVFYIAEQAIYHGRYYKFKSDYSGVELAPEYSDAKEAVGAVINLQSLVDTYILNEIVCDLDVDWSSFYFSLDMTASGNKKLTFEAPWDFDSGFGIIDKKNCSDPESLYAAVQANPWFGLVVNEDWFAEMVREKWAEIKDYGVLDGAIELIEIEKESYSYYYICNYEKWSTRVTQGNGEVIYELNTYKNINTAQGLAADYLKNWLTRRFAYLDSLWGTD